MNTIYAALEAVRRGAPASTSGPTRDPMAAVRRPNFRTKFRSLKNGRFLRCESLLEHEVMKLFELSPEVERFTEQPQPLQLKFEGPRRGSRYTPDLWIDWKDGWPWLVEVKPRELAELPCWRTKIKAAALAAAARGCHFVVVTEVHLANACIADVDKVLLRRHRQHVENLGDPPQPTVEAPISDVERRVLDVLAGALNESPSYEALEALGLAKLSGRTRQWGFGSSSGHSAHGPSGGTTRSKPTARKAV